ncbi:MAG: RNA methyltransferase [Planctomycetes bacterium]|nr:RNA methyltransferase [Planctomycetota bacterium]
MSKKPGYDQPDSPEYLARKEYFRQFMTLYGRKTVLEALAREDVEIAKIHLAEGSKGEIINEINQLARERGVQIIHTTRAKVTRISKNGKQDQGIAADVKVAGFIFAKDFLQAPPEAFALLALDGVTTPRNVGMAIRSATAGGLDGIILPERGGCGICPLVIKASAGTVFQTKILRCEQLLPVLETCEEMEIEICSLSSDASEKLFEYIPPRRVIYILGGESNGVSPEIKNLATHNLSIPMSAGVESLNVAVTAALVAYQNLLRQG